MGPALHCTACRLRSAYNRAVVDLVRDEAIGCLCTNCIATCFGTSLDRDGGDDGGCVLCDRDGFMALPKWEAVTVQVEGDVHIHGVDFDVTPETPRLCDHHLHDLCDERVREDLPDPAPGTP